MPHPSSPSQPDVSIILVNYNQGKLVQDCIASVKQHTSPTLKLEWFVVDNSDREKVNEWLTPFDDVQLISNSENKGFGAANNQALAKARGTFVLFLNNDTLFIEDTLSRLLEFYATRKEPAMVGCTLLNEDLSHQESIVDNDTLLNYFSEAVFIYKLFPRVKALNRYHLNYKKLHQPLEVDVIKGAFMFAETSHIQALGGFDEDFFFYSEENDLCRRFQQSGGKVWYYPHTSIIHLGGATTEHMKWFSMMHLTRSRLLYFQKHVHPLVLPLYYAIHYLTYVLRIPWNVVLGLVTFNSSAFQKAWMYFRGLFIWPTVRKPVS